MKKTDFSQLFLLRPSAPPGAYVRITFHSALQQQLEDMRYYIAVRHVAVYGTIIDTSALAREGMRGLEWPCAHARPGASTPAAPGELATQALAWSHLTHAGAGAGAPAGERAAAGESPARCSRVVPAGRSGPAAWPTAEPAEGAAASLYEWRVTGGGGGGGG